MLVRVLLNTPIWAKAFAASVVLLLCLVGLGSTAYLTLDNSAHGLKQLRGANLPKQNAVAALTGDVIATHVKLFRHVTWGSNGVSPALLKSLSAEIVADLEAMKDRFYSLASQPSVSPAEREKWITLSAKWQKYERAARDTLDVGATDAPMATMMLGATDDDFQQVGSELQSLSALVSDRTASVTGALADEAESKKWILALGGLTGILISALVTLFVAGSIVGPIRSVTQAMSQISTGNTDVDLGCGDRKDEIGQMIDAISVFRLNLQLQKEELHTQNLRFDAALNNMSQGVCMVDPAERLVVCNGRYARMYGLSSEQVKPGTMVRDIVAHRIANGFYVGADPEAYSRELLAFAKSDRPATTIQALNDGRVISIATQPMPGGGWVGTHEDVTDRHRLQGQLKQQNEQLDAVLNNMSQGVAMFDAEQRLVVCNDQYLAMYRFSREVFKPGMPLRQMIQLRLNSGLQSDKSPDEIVEAMVESRNSPKSGQFYSQLSDGRCIAISAQPMPGGGTVTTHEDVTERRRAEAQIAHMAMHDALTELPNRVLLRERLELALARSGEEQLAVLCLDLDRFKEVNDTLGHPVGDALLRIAAKRLRSCIREVDTVARLGGDEFAIVGIASGATEDARKLARRIIDELSRPYEFENHQIVIGISIGIAFAPSDGTDPDQLLKNADLALYRAKAEGRSTYRFFEPAMDSSMKARRGLDLDLRKALTNGEFELYYQPFVNLERNEVSGFEALLRWNHPERGKVAPVEFIPLAEETGLIVPIGQWVLRQACSEAARWPEHIRLAVNLSAVQLKTANLVQTVFNALAVSGLASQRLELEVTESVLIRDGEAAIATLSELRDLGVRIALDDFGKGYSSLSYLRSFPFDGIKIDRCFVNDLSGTDAGSLAIVRAVAQLGTTLGMPTTAEGVETQEQLNLVREEGYTEVQGYFFSPPRPAQEIPDLFFLRTEGSTRAA